METNYVCPTCSGQLNVKDNIVMIIKDLKGNQGLVFLHTELGNYTSEMNSSIKISKGDAVDFFCPYCHVNIEYHKEKSELVSLFREDRDGKKSQIIFSKVYGEERTYHIEEDKVLSYGQHTKHFMDPEWFLR